MSRVVTERDSLAKRTSRSPRVTSIWPDENTRWTSLRPRAPTRTFCPSVSMPTPSRSRTASRYESVATRRIPAAVAARRTPVRIGRGVVARGGRDDLPQRLRERLGVDGHRGALRLADPWELVGREQAHSGPCRAGRDAGVVTLDLECHRAGLEARGEPVEELGRHDRLAGLVDLGGDRDPDREIEVGAHELDLVLPGGHLHAGQHRERAATDGHRSLGGADRFGEGVALAAELHCPPPGYEENCSVVLVVGPVDCGSCTVVAGGMVCGRPHRRHPFPPFANPRRVISRGFPRVRRDIPSVPQGYPPVPCRTRLISSLTWSNTWWRSVMSALIFSTAWMTVVWSRPPNCSAIRG